MPPITPQSGIRTTSHAHQTGVLSTDGHMGPAITNDLQSFGKLS
jgi:hypothetical protein